MGTPEPPEKGIVLKGWEKLDDDVIIKEVSTKGKHVNLCIQFLADRNELSTREAKNYFLQKVNAYVYRLLANRQLFKAHHILTNIDRVPKYVFYQIATETTDRGLREYIQQHLARTIENYEQGEKDRIGAYWRVYTQLKANVRQMADVLNEVSSGYSVLEIETMSFNTFCMKEDLYRNTVAVDLFFKNQESEISPILDRYTVWSYLLKNNISNLVKIWIQLNSCLRNCVHKGIDPTPDILRIKIDIYDDPRFNERLRQLFQRWEIDDFMLSQLSHHRTLARSEILLNELARLGKFLDHERTDATAILRRLFTTETYDRTPGFTEERWFREQITRRLVDNQFFTLLGLPIVSREVLQKIVAEEATPSDDACSMQPREEVNLFLELQKLNQNTPIGANELLGVSRTCSRYILQHNRHFYEENPIVSLFEYGLDEQNTCFPDDPDEPLLSRLPHLGAFVRRYELPTEATTKSSALEEAMGKLLEIAGIPAPQTIQTHLFSTSGEDEDERSLRLELLQQYGSIPHFNHPLLIEKYGQPVRLRYLHYIRLQRACYAVYEFYREQLKNYSQISTRQINSAAQTVAQLAIERYWDQSLVTHAIAFMEMIGVSSVPTRAYLRCLTLVHQDHDQPMTSRTLSIAELLLRCELTIASKSLDDPELLIDLEAMTVVAKANGLQLPERYLRERLLAGNDWFRFLLLVDYLGYPPQQIIELCRAGFGDGKIGMNLMTALLHQPKIDENREVAIRRRSSLTPRRRRRGSSTTGESSGHSSVSSEGDAISNRSATGLISSTASTTTQPMNTPLTSVSMSSYTSTTYDGACFLSERYDTDLVSTVLLCSNEANPYATSATLHPFDFALFIRLMRTATESLQAPRYPHTYQNLLDRAIRSRWPLLALFAGEVCPRDSEALRYCWIVWVTLAGEYPFRNRPQTEPPTADGVFECDERTFVCDLVEYLVREDRICTLASSLAVFYPGSNWDHLASYLSLTRDVLFDGERAAQLLTAFLATTTGDECFLLRQPKYEMFNFCARLLTLHLCNRSSVHHQQLLLQSYIRSDIRCFLTTAIDFERMLRVCEIVRNCDVANDVLRFFERAGDVRTQVTENESGLYEALCEQLVARKCHEAAIAVAVEAGLPKESIIFEHWVSYFESTGTLGDFERYRADSERFGLGPELRINFFTHIANRLEYGDPARYEVLRWALVLIREHGLYPSESFDRDRVEYELALSYVRCSDSTAQSLALYCSQYWTSSRLQRSSSTVQQPVLYHTFLELKEVAGIDDLTLANVPLAQPDEKRRLDALINRLLDCGDIVQALRYQAIFEQRPIDLHFIVFCMALAEGLVSLYNLSKEERMLLNEDSARTAGKFQRRTLRISRVSQSSATGRYDGSPMKSTAGVGGTGTAGQLNSSDMSNTAASDFEELPSRDRQDIFEAISGLGNRITYGQDLAQRVVLTYRAAMYLDREYNELLKLRDPLAFLPEIVHEDCSHKLEVISDIVTATRMSVESFTDFLAAEIVSTVVRSKFYLFQQHAQPNVTSTCDELLWGYNIDREFHLFLELAPNTTALGNALLRYCDTLRLYRKWDRQDTGDGNVQDALESLESAPSSSSTDSGGANLIERLDRILQQRVLSLKKQNTIIVALLVKAHDCFVHECSMEGIMEVLTCCKSLTLALTAAQSWNLIVRLLVGIGRYRDMCYCFETLIKHEQFESLLGQFDDRGASGRLQTAIMAYLNEHCPERKDYFRLAALHFRMYKEIAEMWEAEARATIDAVLATYEQRQLVVRKETTVCLQRLQTTALVLAELTTAMDAFTHATENYLLDNNLTLAQRAASNAELLALQIFFVRQVLNTERAAGGGPTNSSACSSNATSPSRTSSSSGGASGSVGGSQDNGTCLSVLNIRSMDESGASSHVASGTLLYYINFLLTVPQALIVGRAYGVEINWAAAIYQHYVIDGQSAYVEDYLERLSLTDPMIETLVKMFQLEPQITPTMEQAIGTFIERIQSVTLKYRLASLLGLKKTIHALINGGAVYYLKDTNYGKSDTEPGSGVPGGSGSSSGVPGSTAGGSGIGNAGGAAIMSGSIRSSSSNSNTTTSTATSA
ncbi:uncharacterized protein LOC131207911 [Anopheles bellator]|uniref:uncharacterized protein LOC131207911 n=1 Tax=Anopheles bellator TaxID=139047 RepID=UPI002649FC9F|nr:uncharacterized protein LOC131207911 [Anopheles bellator]